MTFSRFASLAVLSISVSFLTVNAQAYPYLQSSPANTAPKPPIQKAVSVAPSYSPDFIQAIQLYKAGKLTDALVKCKTAIAKEPKNSAAMGLAAFLIMHTGGDLGEAEQYLRLAVKIDPHNPTDLANLGSVLGQEGRFAASIPFLKSAYSVNPKDMFNAARLAGAYAQTGDQNDALVIFAKCVSDPSCTPQIYKNYGLTLAHAKQYAKAAKVYEHAAKLDATDAASWSSAGLLYGMIRDYPSTARCLSQAVKLGPTDPFRVRFTYGCALSALGKHIEASKQFQYASILQPNEFAAWYDLGLEYEALNQLDDAISAFRQAHQLDPNQTAATVNLANSLIRNKQASQAIDVLHGAVASQPNSPELHAAMADSYLANNDIKNASTELEKTVKLSPNDNLSRASLAELDMRSKNFTDALTEYDALLKAAPQSDSIMTQRGEALIDLKRYVEAEATLKTAVTINPKNARAWNNLGAAHEYLNEPKLAIQDYRSGEAADPTLGIIKQNLARLLNPPKLVPTQVKSTQTLPPGAVIAKPIVTNTNPSSTPTPPAPASPAPNPSPSPTPAPTPNMSPGTITP